MIGNETEALRGAFDGPVLGPDDDGYDEARRPWQLKVDAHPALIVDAAGPEDVQAAVRAAREHDTHLAVQSTGHGAVPRPAGGLMVRTGRMDAVTVDAERATARVGAGATWAAVIEQAAPHGLAPLSGSSPTVGAVGYTLGGGAGWLSRKYGYAADSVISAEVVTAGGERVTASADENPDLFWALRGGGGNFGIVTELEFRLHPAERVYAGIAMYEAERAADVLAVYRDWSADEPDELHTALVAMTVPPIPVFPEEVRGRRVLMLRAAYLGSAAEAEDALAPLRQAAGDPLLNAYREMAFPELATLGPPPAPLATSMRIELFRELKDAVIEIGVNAGPGVAGVEFHHWGGAPSRPGPDAGPVGHRDVPFSVVVAGMTEDPAETPKMAAAVDKVADRLAEHSTGGAFVNFIGDPARTRSAYTEDDYRRLRAIKSEWDPDNLLRVNLNIPPA